MEPDVEEYARVLWDFVKYGIPEPGCFTFEDQCAIVDAFWPAIDMETLSESWNHPDLDCIAAGRGCARCAEWFYAKKKEKRVGSCVLSSSLLSAANVCSLEGLRWLRSKYDWTNWMADNASAISVYDYKRSLYDMCPSRDGGAEVRKWMYENVRVSGDTVIATLESAVLNYPAENDLFMFIMMGKHEKQNTISRSALNHPEKLVRILRHARNCHANDVAKILCDEWLIMEGVPAVGGCTAAERHRAILYDVFATYDSVGAGGFDDPWLSARYLFCLFGISDADGHWLLEPIYREMSRDTLLFDRANQIAHGVRVPK